MKILYVITKSNWGGAQRYVYDLAIKMRDDGHQVRVAFGGHGLLADKLEEKGIDIIEIPNLERDVNLSKELKVLQSLYKILKKEDPDIVHLNSSKIGAVGSFIARLAGIRKIIFTAHGFPFREERPYWQVVLIKILSWLSIILSDKTICVSKKDFNDVKDWPLVKNKIITIHNGIDLNSKINSDCIKEKGITRIVSIGELHKNKGFEYALRAINELKEKAKDFRYTILSFGGDERHALEKIIIDLNLENYVDILIEEEASSGKLGEFDIYFMPSIKEGLPYVLLEAGLYGLPIVASDTGGICEIVENYKNGFLIKTKDVNGFELALEKLICDERLRREMGDNAKWKIESEFNLDTMIGRTMEVYKYK